MLSLKQTFLMSALLFGLSATANAQAIVQNNAINIAAVVTVGGPPASVTQNGKYNYAGVVQAGVSPSAAIVQNGRALNSAFIAQTGRTSAVGSIAQSGGPFVRNSAAVGQTILPASFGGLRRR